MTLTVYINDDYVGLIVSCFIRNALVSRIVPLTSEQNDSCLIGNDVLTEFPELCGQEVCNDTPSKKHRFHTVD